MRIGVELGQRGPVRRQRLFQTDAGGGAGAAAARLVPAEVDVPQVRAVRIRAEGQRQIEVPAVVAAAAPRGAERGGDRPTVGGVQHALGAQALRGGGMRRGVVAVAQAEFGAGDIAGRRQGQLARRRGQAQPALELAMAALGGGGVVDVQAGAGARGAGVQQQRREQEKQAKTEKHRRAPDERNRQRPPGSGLRWNCSAWENERAPTPRWTGVGEGRCGLRATRLRSARTEPTWDIPDLKRSVSASAAAKV